MALAKNSLLSVLPPVVSMLVGIFSVPFYLEAVGIERYGALLIALVLLGYFGQADLGLGRALTQKLSAQRSAGPPERASIVWSAMAGATAISVIGAGLIYLAAVVFFGSFFEASAALKVEAIDSAWLFALCVPVIMYTGVSSGALMGVERFGVVSIGTMVGNFLSQVLPLVVAMLYSAELVFLLAALLVGRLIGLLLIIGSMWSVLLHRQPVHISGAHLRQLFVFGVWIMVTAIVGPLMTMSDRVVIGATIGSAAVVAYSVPFIIAQRTINFPLAIVNALFPRLAAQTQQQSDVLGKASVVLVGQLYAFLVAGLICLAEPLLQLWLGEKLDPRSVLVGQIALAGFWFNAVANVPYALIQARGDSRFTAILHLSELPLYFVVLFMLGTTLGLTGIAIAFALRTLFDCGVLFYRARFLVNDVLSCLIGPTTVVAIAVAVSPQISGWPLGIAAASLCSVALVILSWFQMPSIAKNRLLDHWARAQT